MSVLDEVIKMKMQGTSEQEIINRLQEKGVSPREINDALSQAQIKNAVSESMENQDLYSYPQTPSLPEASPNQTPYTPQTQETSGFPEQELYAPQPQETYSPQPQEEYYPQETYSPQQEFYQPGAYSDYPTSGGDYTENIIEIAEQVFSEKIQKIQKQLDEINEFKTLAQTKIDSIAEKIKRIETTIDKLQIAILDRIGSYGRNLDSIKKEMSMMQDSFGKLVNKAVKTRTTPSPKKTQSKTKTKKSSKKK